MIQLGADCPLRRLLWVNTILLIRRRGTRRSLIRKGWKPRGDGTRMTRRLLIRGNALPQNLILISVSVFLLNVNVLPLF